MVVVEEVGGTEEVGGNEVCNSVNGKHVCLLFLFLFLYHNHHIQNYLDFEVLVKVQQLTGASSHPLLVPHSSNHLD